MEEQFTEIPLVDHHCHAIIKQHVKNDCQLLLSASSEAPETFSKIDLHERLTWQALIKMVGQFANREFADEREFADFLLSVDYENFTYHLFTKANYQSLFIDTGYTPKGACTIKQMSKLTGTTVFPILRLESVAERVFKKTNSFSDWWQLCYEEIAHARESGYIGAKSIAAYRCGLELLPVSYEEAEMAYKIWNDRGSERIVDNQLISFLVWESAPLLAQQSLPLQFHAGYGDPDTNLMKGNPLLLRSFIQKCETIKLPVVLLHNYPYQREAGYLASVYNCVYFDTSLIVPLGIGASRRVVSEALELAPYTKYLFASDAHTRPEIFALAAQAFRDAISFHLNDPLVLKYATFEKKQDWIRHICQINANQLYLNKEGD